MATKTDKELPSSARASWLKAMSAMELKNYGYAIQLLQAVLKECPEFLDGRKVLRKSEIAATKGKKSMFGGLSTLGLKGSSTLKKDPKAALEMAEKELESEPYSSAANHLLHDAAVALGMVETATFALETLAEGSPKDVKVLHELGQHYYDNGQSEKAVEIYTRIAEINPADLIAVKRGKDAAARASMKSGGWEAVADSGGKMDYRDLIKNKEEATSLEQKGRVVKSEEMIEQQLAELGEKWEGMQDNIDLSRRIAALYEQKNDLPTAIQWYEYTLGLSNGTDATIQRKVNDLQQKQRDQHITEYEKWVADYPDHEETPRVKEDLANLVREKRESLVAEARKRVERNPTDLQLRFEYGEQLVLNGNFNEAIPELQKARQNPNTATRVRAMYLLGQCYVAKNMNDFAVRTYTETTKELSSMDNVKKEIVYDLGLIYERMEKKDEYLDCMKQIYDVDYGYKDVAHRVESSYQ